MPAIDLATVTADTFEPWLQSGFRLRTDGGEIELTLAEVKPLGQAARTGGAFSLLLVAKAGPVLPQAIYTITQADLGTLEIFLVPIGPAPGGMGYEAVFA
jgi:hypothetical protein